MGLCAHSVSNCIIVKISVRCMCWCLVFWERTSVWYLASEEANIGRKGYEPWGCSFTVSMSIFAGAIDMHHNRLAEGPSPSGDRDASNSQPQKEVLLEIRQPCSHKSALYLYWFTHQQKGWVTWCTAMAYILTLTPLYCCSLATTKSHVHLRSDHLYW